MRTVDELAALVGGEVLGDGSRHIRDLADLRSAGPEHLSFLANPKYRKQFDDTRAGAVLVRERIEGAQPVLIVVPDPYLAMAQVAKDLHPTQVLYPGVHDGAHVALHADVHATAAVCVGAIVEDGAVIGPRSVISPGAYVGPDAVIGADVYLHPGAHVLERCQIGDRCILHCGSVIGSDGFGYAPDADGRRHKIPQVGIVVLEADVEVGACTTIDRATFGETRIGRGTKIDNLVQIAHNVKLGEDCIVVSQSGIAGSTRLGARVIMGAQTGVVGHIDIADDVMLGARAAVAGTVGDAGIYSGTPAIPHKEWLKMVVAQRYVPELRNRVRELEKKIEELSRRLP